MAPRDPLRYFRIEARELLEGLNQGVLELGRGGPPEETVKRLLRLAHTLKGASRVVRLPVLSDLAHRVEDALQDPAGMDALPGLLQSIAHGLDGLGEAPNAAPVPGAGAGPAAGEATQGAVPSEVTRPDTVRLEIAELDSVLNGLREVGARLALLRGRTAGLELARRLARDLAVQGPAEGRGSARELGAWLERFDGEVLDALDQAERELLLAHDRAGRLRLLPAAVLFDFLERVAQDAAKALGRRIRFESVGAEQRLDAAMVASLQEAFQHLVRNAVVHGVEDPADRLAQGKDAQGTVRLSLTRQGGQLLLLCSDDGRGIQTEAVRRAAVARGILPEEGLSGFDARAAVDLLLKGGISTAQKVSELAGRGLGMDTVRAVVERLRGELAVRSRPGLGTEVEIRVPGSLVSFDVLAVEAAGRTALVPFNAVRGVLSLRSEDFARSPEGDRVLLPQGGLPYLALRPLLRGSGGASGPLPAAGVHVRAHGGEVVLGVDRVLGVREALVQPLPEFSPRPRFASGACLDSVGDACLVLDPEGLLAEALSLRGEAFPASPGEPPPLLVVDDSLTTRMLEQSILETAGYKVDLATSGEEGLTMARRRRYGLILVDVEMPGMSGFEFVESLGADPELKAVPAILVTSRDAPEDRRRGQAAGAKDYIVKGEFDQARLLGRIRELLAWAR